MDQDFHKMLSKLIALDFDAMQAYQAAIQRIESAPTRKVLTEFMADHARHSQDLGRILVEAGKSSPPNGDLRRLWTKGRVVVAGFAGDQAILQALKQHEDHTNLAYERAADHPEIPDSLRDALRQALDDERRHRAWFERQLAGSPRAG